MVLLSRRWNGNRSGKPPIHHPPDPSLPTPFNPTITPSTTSIPKKRRKGDPSKIGVPGYSKHGVPLGRKSRSTERKEEEEKENIDKKVEHSDALVELVKKWEKNEISDRDFIKLTVEKTIKIMGVNIPYSLHNLFFL